MTKNNYKINIENKKSIFDLKDENYIKEYTKNNIYMLNGLYNGNNIFNSNYFKFITSTLDLFKIISSNISKYFKY